MDIRYIPLGLLAPWEMAGRGIKIGGKAWFVTLAEVRFYSDIAKGIITIPAGYLTDLASIPNGIQGFFMMHDAPTIGMGALVHDFLYEAKGAITVLVKEPEGLKPFRNLLTREQADQILCHEAMADLGASQVQIDTVYQTLRRVGDGWGDNYPLTERLAA